MYCSWFAILFLFPLLVFALVLCLLVVQKPILESYGHTDDQDWDTMIGPYKPVAPPVGHNYLDDGMRPGDWEMLLDELTALDGPPVTDCAVIYSSPPDSLLHANLLSIERRLEALTGEKDWLCRRFRVLEGCTSEDGLSYRWHLTACFEHGVRISCSPPR